MALDVRSLFVGAAGVLGILVLGFGGGVMMSGVLTDGPREPNKLEKQAAKETKPPSSSSDGCVFHRLPPRLGSGNRT